MTSASRAERRFSYGLEIELLLARSADFEPLSYRELTAQEMFEVIGRIDTSDLPTDGMNTKPLHPGPLHYLVEGYTLTDEQFKPQSLLPKGIEIRTPAVGSISEVLALTGVLHTRLREALAERGMTPLVLAHHPTAPDCDGRRNYRRDDYWRWAQTVTTSYGPDINVSLPAEFEHHIASETLHNRINFYAPSVVALSLNSPLYLGSIFRVHGQDALSVRTYRRSIYAPMYYIHKEPELRFEFKGLEMASSQADYNAYFLCVLALLLDDKLNEQASDQSRIYDLGKIAVEGLHLDFARTRAETVLLGAERIARQLKLSSSCLDEMHSRIEKKRCPANHVISLFKETGDIRQTLKLLPAFEETEKLACSSNRHS